MTREDYQMAKNIIEEVGKYKNILKHINDENRYMHISFRETHEYGKVWLNNPDIIGEEEKERLNNSVRQSLRYLLESKIIKLEKELDEL